MNKLDVSCSQNQIDLLLGFTASEVTPAEFDEQKLKGWIAYRLSNWVNLKICQQQKYFNLNSPIKIEVKWNDKLKISLTQKRVSELSLKKFKHDILFKMKNSFYVLRKFEASSLSKKVSSPKLPQNTVNSGSSSHILNAIEYYSLESNSYGSPIIYTGMID